MLYCSADYSSEIAVCSLFVSGDSSVTLAGDWSCSLVFLFPVIQFLDLKCGGEET